MESDGDAAASWSKAELAEVTLLHINGVGPRLRMNLLERFGSIDAAFGASARELREVHGFGSRLLDNWRETLASFDPLKHVEACEQLDIQLLFRSSKAYPLPLAEIPDAPSVIYSRGSLQKKDALAIAIVGTRRATSYGKRQAARFSTGLARCGFTIVSGLARGIDAASHEAALNAGGRTIGVLGSGLESIYPPEHEELARQVAASGALISEMRPGSRPRSGSFPRRNRIISGLSLAVLVVEATARSGALITARHALEQNREVMAIPGRIDQLGSRGCHALIRDGAKLVESLDDVLEELGPLAVAVESEDGTVVKQPSELMLNDQEKALVFSIPDEPIEIDELTRVTGLPIHRVLATISALEARRVVRRVEGNRVVRSH